MEVGDQDIIFGTFSSISEEIDHKPGFIGTSLSVVKGQDENELVCG